MKSAWLIPLTLCSPTVVGAEEPLNTYIEGMAVLAAKCEVAVSLLEQFPKDGTTASHETQLLAAYLAGLVDGLESNDETIPNYAANLASLRANCKTTIRAAAIEVGEIRLEEALEWAEERGREAAMDELRSDEYQEPQP